MSQRDPWVRVLHMRDYATQAVDMARGRAREDLHSDFMYRYALVHLVELVGEAAAHVDQAIREMSPDIPWGDMVDTRNRLIHGYDYIDYEVLWDIVTNDLPPLLEELGKLLATK